MLHKEAIRALIPHAGAMCLPDRVVQWDAEGVLCEADNHRDPGHPLRDAGRLGAVCALEYAAQAMALHGALASGAPAGGGFLAAVRGLRLHAERLDTVAGTLRVEARRLGGDAAGFVYAFSVEGEGRLLAEGRATVMNRRAADTRQ